VTQSKSPLFVSVSTLHGAKILQCSLPEFQRLQEGLLRKHGVLRVDVSSKPKEPPMIPSSFPFREPPSVLLATRTPAGISLSIEIPMTVQSGQTVRLCMDLLLKSTDEGSIQRGLRAELHKRISLSQSALDCYRDWFRESAQGIIQAAIEEASTDFEDTSVE
jgi:hypothetical protein